MLANKPPLAIKPLLLLVVIKLMVHIVVNFTTDFGLHRDEFLYLAEGDHLAWGFMEVPPLVPFIAWITDTFLGVSVVAVRISTVIIGAATVFMTGSLVREMGGNKTAQIIAATGILISPVFLGSNNLFQPVSFNQFWWLAICYLSVKIVNSGKYKDWYFLGFVVGLAVLTKYSVAFLIVALLGAILISPHRSIIWKKQMVVAIIIAFIVSLPNILWQIKYNFPVVRHMTELATTQLVNIRFLDFLVPQILFHFGCALLWISGLIFVFTHPSMKKYRFLGWTYVFVFLLILSLDGKAYYVFGIYSTMYAFGGLAWESWMRKKAYYVISFVSLINLPAYFYALPILSPVSNVRVMGYFKDHLGLDAPLRWENGEYKNLSQDYADMLGWQELPGKVAKVYQSLSEEEKAMTMIYGGSYGHAGVLNLGRDQYDLPETMSLSSSFVAWADENYQFDRQIFIDDRKQSSSNFFNNIVLMDSIEHPLARDRGYIYYRTEPKVDVMKAWNEIVTQRKKEAGLIQ